MCSILLSWPGCCPRAIHSSNISSAGSSALNPVPVPSTHPATACYCLQGLTGLRSLSITRGPQAPPSQHSAYTATAASEAVPSLSQALLHLSSCTCLSSLKLQFLSYDARPQGPQLPPHGHVRKPCARQLAAVRRLKQLKVLHVQGHTWVEDSDLFLVAALPSLQQLHLHLDLDNPSLELWREQQAWWGAGAGMVGAGAGAGLPLQLAPAHLGSNSRPYTGGGISSWGLEALAMALPCLRALSLSHCPLSRDALGHSMHHFKQLQHLCLAGACVKQLQHVYQAGACVCAWV